MPRERIGNFKRSNIEFIINFSSIFFTSFRERKKKVNFVSFFLFDELHSFIIMELIVHNNYTSVCVTTNSFRRAIDFFCLIGNGRKITKKKLNARKRRNNMCGSLTQTYFVERCNIIPFLQLTAKLRSSNEIRKSKQAISVGN